MTQALRLNLLPERFAICQLPADAALPGWAAGNFFAIVRTPEELSVVCRDDAAPAEVRAERGWRALRVAGTLDFALTGILAAIAAPLAEAAISIFAISTYDTDYVLVREITLAQAVDALTAAGHLVDQP